MGGMSFKCPLCKDKSWWSLTKQGLKDHVRDKHGLPNAVLTMQGPFVASIEFDYCGVRCTETYQ